MTKPVERISELRGKTISRVEFSDTHLKIEFTDGTHIVVAYEGMSE